MSRSKHTRPNKIRAADRVRAPFEPRGLDDTSSARLITRELKEDGIILDYDETESDEELDPRLPRVITKRPRPGHFHPASKSDILQVLEFFGEECFYGLKTIKLMQGSATCGNMTLLMGRLDVPGTIILYDQAISPWPINGTLPKVSKHVLDSAGAKLEICAGGLQTLIHWNGDSLKNFMLFEVLMHEIGHHLIQQFSGKKGVRVARTKDHEHYAKLFAQKCRDSYLGDELSEAHA